MRLRPLKLKGAYEIEFNRIADERGYFMRSYDHDVFADLGLRTDWKQESTSFNRLKNTVRGLHFQKPPYVESKIVRVSQGAILDVLVDLRKDSLTFGEWYSAELSVENNKALYIPGGFAHGFRTLVDNSMIEYKIDVPYHADLADGIRWNDESLSIDWGVQEPIISERDRSLQYFADFDSPF